MDICIKKWRKFSKCSHRPLIQHNMYSADPNRGRISSCQVDVTDKDDGWLFKKKHPPSNTQYTLCTGAIQSCHVNGLHFKAAAKVEVVVSSIKRNAKYRRHKSIFKMNTPTHDDDGFLFFFTCIRNSNSRTTAIWRIYFGTRFLCVNGGP